MKHTKLNDMEEVNNIVGKVCSLIFENIAD